MLEILITLTILGFACLVGLLLLVLPLLFIVVLLNNMAAQVRLRRRTELLLEQQQLCVYLQNQRMIQDMSIP